MTINTSSIVYAYADQFLEARRRGGVELPCRDVKVKERDLAATTMTAAFVGLADAEHARLNAGTRGVLLGLRRRPTVFVDPLGGGASLRGLDGDLLASLSDDHDANAVGTIIERLLPMSGDPWGDVIARIEEGMREEGYFWEEERKKKLAKFFLGKKLVPDCERIAALEEQVPSVRKMVDGFAQANAALYEQLITDVRQGIRARQEADGDMD